MPNTAPIQAPAAPQPAPQPDKHGPSSRASALLRFRALAACAFSFLVDSIRCFLRHRSSLHAAGLTYFSLMSLAPLVCLFLLIGRLCGLGDFARDRLNGYIDQVIVSVESGGEDMPAFIENAQDPNTREARRQTAHDFALQARDSLNTFFDRVAAYDVHAMGTAGVILLLWTLISMLGMVENSLNEVWEIPRSRPFLRRIAIYAVMALVLPAFALISASLPLLHLLRRTIAAAFDAIGATGLLPRIALAIVNSSVFGWTISLVFATLGFAFFLAFMPNRHVPFRNAIISGLITAFVFGCWLRLCAVAQVGISRASAMYGSFAVLPIILTWIYIGWQIVLFGGAMTYTLTHKMCYNNLSFEG
ncbi:MAG: YihY/virulence factor BrkB family protein [Kiritimatiellae bacterium]|nr:YihY/virulence factor BrkB family protein [Kiritimatiellia bacterium]